MKLVERLVFLARIYHKFAKERELLLEVIYGHIKQKNMDCKSLMIGDWVMYNPNVFIEDEYEPHKDCESVQIKSGEDIDLAIEGCFAPIPITKEMLLLNGFRKRSHYYELYVEDGDYYFEICNFDDSLSLMFANNGIILKYVHQLQHALRLAGLNELADNFKVE